VQNVAPSNGTRNISWIFLSGITNKAIGFLATLVLARILLPSEFGLYALAFSVLDGASFIKAFGIDQAVIQKKTQIKEDLDIAFTMVFLIGAALCGVVALLSPLFGTIFRNEGLVEVLLFLAPSILLGSINRIPAAILESRLEFRKKSLAEMCGWVIYPFVAIFLGLHGWGVRCLIFAYLTRQITTFLLIAYFARYIPRFAFRMETARGLFGFGKFVAGSSMLEYFRTNLDILIIGAILGVAELGRYTIVLGLATLIGQTMVLFLSRFFFPVYVKVGEETFRIQALVIQSIKLVGFVSFPLALLLFFWGRDLILVLYGPTWTGAASVLRYLAVYGLMKSIFDIMNPLFRGRGLPNVELKTKTIQFLTLLIVIAPCLYVFKLDGAGIALLLSLVPTGIAIGYWLPKVGVKPLGIFPALSPIYWGTAGMGLYLWIVNRNGYLESDGTSRFRIAFTVFGGALVYLVLLAALEMKTLRRIYADFLLEGGMR
jgi:O-antigen/teichoic acid export membrane protein